MKRWYVIPVILLIVAVPTYLFLFDEGYCPDIEELEDGKIQVMQEKVLSMPHSRWLVPKDQVF